MTQLAIVGCGDVAFRTYFPGLLAMPDPPQVVACFDPVAERADRAATLFGATAYTSLADLIHHPSVDGVINLTPVPFHREITNAALEAGWHVFSEKPLASSVAEAQELIAHAKQRDRLLICAPGIFATNRFQWIKEILRAGRIGRPTLITAHLSGMGPAAWRAYTGDPAVFYSASVGPLIDQGVYLLHAITGLFGPAKRLQAMGGIAIPERTMLAGPNIGATVPMGTNDHMLIQLDFGNTMFAQILSSYAVPGTKTPPIEIHGTTASISIDDFYNANGGIDLYQRDGTTLGLDGWTHINPPTSSPISSIIFAAAAHFVGCIRGTQQPILTAEHATHVLEIMTKAEQAVRDGTSIALETTF